MSVGGPHVVVRSKVTKGPGIAGGGVRDRAAPAFTFLPARDGYLHSDITFARTSVGTYWGSSGVLQEAASGEARFTHDPSDDTPLGLLVEESRTNSSRHSENFPSGYHGKTNVTVTGDQAAAPDGSTTADQLDFGANASDRIGPTVTDDTSAGTEYTLSVWVKADQAENIRLGFFDNGASGSQVSSDLPVTTEWTRITFTATYAGDSTARTYDIRNESGGGTKTIFAWGAQLEAGANETSYAGETTTSARTRAAETATISHSPPSTFTIVLKARTGLGAGVLWSWDDGTANERIYVERNASNEIHLIVVDSGTTQADLNLGTVADETDFTVAFRIAANDIAASLDGGTVSTDTSATLSTVDTERFGHDFNDANHWNATLAQRLIYDRGLSNGEIKALAA